MNLYRKLRARAAEGKPLRIGLIGAGKFGSMYLAQAKHTPGIHMVAIADLAPDRAHAALPRSGWPAERIKARSFDAADRDGTTFVTDDALAVIDASEIDIASEAPGTPAD